MRKIICAFLCIVLLCGCSMVNVEETTRAEEKSMFIQIESTYNWIIVYHEDTKVMYAVSQGSYNHGNFTVLVNPDGTPMVWKGGAE